MEQQQNHQQQELLQAQPEAQQKATQATQTLRILHISDTHNHLSGETPASLLPPADVLVHTGDFSNSGTVKEYIQFNAWLGSVAHKYRHRIVVLGNHDVFKLRDDWDLARDLLPNATAVPFFEELDVEGLRVYGSPWLYFQNGGYATRKPFRRMPNLEHRFDEIPEGLDLLLTHGPARGLRDMTTSEEHIGSRDLYRELMRKRPAMHLFGHIHEDRGTRVHNGVTAINSALCDHDSSEGISNRPHLIIATRPDPRRRFTFTIRDVPIARHWEAED